ncbi:sigma-70 family RNA polymerase sigma factor [Ulvibacter litoralis]|uniref:RNA polymerase sigma-70 factor, ECF subfamily n=1 Tax=Ulvibacter litoralis TaxID=227084 RepID=A0A1G7IGT9_9FLAO|nr:sigma-70 family RNA polymerase sigma factor [Ulvibacter litoralis]GHC60795.1 DNA-directed RNA polymerase sigma-70 factor [Ulvibacter litoralis]SDF11951.1 RNA polymerase sigma-70 factor, ECF subfamily [Ulvibacter litoralis]
MNLNTNYQNILFPYAYNILGSVDDAMDAIQDVITKYISSSKPNIENEISYLIKGVINQSINIKKRNQKTTGDKIWLPEPISTEKADTNINREEIISYSMLVLLEKLNPKERAVFILKEAFDYSHEEIATAMSFSIENSRKILSRAKKALEKMKKDFEPSPMASPTFLKEYITSIKTGNVSALEKLLSDDIMVKTDGGNVSIVSELMVGIKEVIKLMIYVYNTYQKSFSIVESTVNHQPALMFYNDGKLVNCQVFELEKDNEKIMTIYSIVDPEKLKK